MRDRPGPKTARRLTQQWADHIRMLKREREAIRNDSSRDYAERA